MASYSYKPATIHCHPYRARPYPASWLSASKLLGLAVDHSDQPLYPRQYMAHFSQHVNSLLLRKLPVHIAWGEKIPHSLLLRRHIGEHSLSPSSTITIFHSYRCLRSHLCPGGSTRGDETKIESVCYSHTSPASPLGGGYWWFHYTLLFPKCSLAGSPWRSSSRLSSRLLLPKEGTVFLHSALARS